MCAAAKAGRAEIIQKLCMDYRADIMVVRDRDGATPLTVSAMFEQPECTLALVRAMSLLPPRMALEYLQHEDKRGKTARAWGVEKGNTRVVDALDEAEQKTLSRHVTCRHKCMWVPETN